MSTHPPGEFSKWQAKIQAEEALILAEQDVARLRRRLSDAQANARRARDVADNARLAWNLAFEADAPRAREGRQS
ncbi:hypothetical protein [Thiocystis violascens]|uniref:Uncharacterized protein n=1 Tax=Thiocystis violascens (strain ATCC 17096 / DSM 198 / 6111) TaxID=765911 RepID=I3YES5_THIV6|nr:hypothetical protein [Thiocystis violascens]AFL75493.1 hypothetical protein Thivi_3639 [Thiocystis violascens DSM 198]